jgi:class 3 adenylate cyclase/tetratricopeptide (TPR) repeat protein
MGEMLEAPEGPVTIMFTDIEGSTALRTSLGDAETDALFRQHDELIRAEIEANKGHDQKAALGDGFLAIFVSTRRAVACAIAIQRALDVFNRTRSGAPLRVRIGLNTGEVAFADGQLSGEAVHAAARVCAEGSGGQILISDVTRQLAGTIPDITFHDAGEHTLKGFPQPWRLWEVVWVRETTAVPEQVFVGREKELATLRAKLAAALDGRGGLVLVGGEPGVGKTTLVKQLIREAEQRGALTVFGRCYESEGTVPYSPFVEMLEQALALMPPDIVREDMGDDASEVARMVPELRRRFPDIPEPLDLPPEQQRRYFFNAVGSFVQRGANRFPLMMVMDDVHWADEPTLLLIEHMAALMPEMRVLGVGTYRDVELEVSRPLAAALERLLRGRLVERIAVKRFDRDGVATMLEALAGRSAPDQVVDAVFDETEGNPFFVEEVFRHLVEDGKIFDESGQFRTDITVDELDVPESVRLVVGRRLERLGDEAQKVLAAGAVVGRGFPFTLLEEISDLDAGRLLDIVEEAESARVIVPEERDGEVHYSFAHELIRQTLLSSLSLLRRQRLHLTVANAIERTDKRARTERPSEIAHHLLQAGAAAEPERTLEYLELTAERAMGAAAFEEALRALEDALSVVEDEDTLRRGRLLEQKGWAVRALGDFDGSVAIFDEASAIYVALGEVDRAASLLYEIGYLMVWLNRFEDAFARYAQGAAMIGDVRTASRALLLSGAGSIAGFGGYLDFAEPQLNEAESIALELGATKELGRTEWGRCMTYWSFGRAQDAIRTGRHAVELLRECGDLWGLADAFPWLGFALALNGAPDEARAFGEEGVALSRKIGHQGAELLNLRAVAIAKMMSDGDLDENFRLASADLERLAALESPWISQSHAWMALACTYAGDLDEGLEHARRSIETEPLSAWSKAGLTALVANRTMAGDVEAVDAALAGELDDIPLGADAVPLGRVGELLTAAESYSRLGRTDLVERLYPFVLEWVERYPVRVFDWTLTARVAGMCAAALERWDEAEAHFEAAIRAAEELSDPGDLPAVQHRYAEMLLARGDVERAEPLLAGALDGYRRLGMPLLAAEVEVLASASNLATSASDAPRP